MSFKPCCLLMLTLAVADSALACNNAIPKTTPDQTFTIHNNGTVTHHTTGLMWMRCVLGQTWSDNTCNGTAQTYQWWTALQMADSYSFAGYSDWRLPNKNELASIVEEACFSPAINTLAFPNDPAWIVWSSSPSAGNSNSAWLAVFDDGRVATNDKKNSYYVRLVRGGQ